MTSTKSRPRVVLHYFWEGVRITLARCLDSLSVGQQSTKPIGSSPIYIVREDVMLGLTVRVLVPPA